jgi:predicted S18 family serine protease
MRLKRLALTVALLFVATFALAAVQQDSRSISATQANTAVTFTDQDGVAFSAFVVTVTNDGGDTVYVNLSSTTATAGTNKEVKIPSGESFTFNRMDRDSPNSSVWVGFSGIGVICAAGETATVRVVALR